MTKVLDHRRGEIEVSEDVTLKLSKQELDLILQKVPEPDQYVDRKVYRMMRDELVGRFKTAR